MGRWADLPDALAEGPGCAISRHSDQANKTELPSNRGLISKIRPSDGCKGNTVPSMVVRGMISANLEVIWAMSV